MKHQNLFTNRGMSPQVEVSPLALVVESLQSVVNQGPGQFATPEVAKAAMALESMSPDKQFQLNTAVTNLSNVIDTCLKTLPGFGKLNVAQESAAIAAGVMASAPQSYFIKPIQTAGSLQAAASGTNTTVIGNNGINGAMESRAFALEAFDTKENKNAMVYSVAYNMQAARQDEFGEAFFPTVVVTPDNVGFMVSIRLIFVQDEVRRELNGSLDKFGRKNVIKAVIDATILRNDQTKIVPIVRTGGGANDSTVNFVAAADVAPYTVTLDTQPVVTAPLAVGKKFSLLGISQTAALLATGILDSTDAIDSAVRLSAVYVKVKADATNPAAVVKFNVDKLPRTDFNYAVQGNTRLLQLNFESDALKVVSTTKKIDGSAVPQFAALTDHTVRLGTTLFGSVLQDKGDTVVNTGELVVAKATTVDGQIMDLTAGTGATIAAIFAGATVIGYDLVAYRTNSNRRQRGQLIDTQYVNHLYTVPLLPPITALRPVGDTEANDSSLLSALITTTHIRTSNAAVGALLDARDFLKDFVSASDAATDAPEILGVARYLVSPAYAEDTLDTETQIDSLKSSDRAEDMVALIINKIRDMAYRLYTTSGYKAACDALFDGAAPKPMVIIGTDPILNRYLTLNGDMRLLGEYFDYKLVSTLDSRMTGKLILTFGMETSYNSGVPNPLHFGAMAWKPELTLMMPIVRNGATTMELTVQPSFRHIVSLPVMGSLDVVGIQNIIADKAVVQTHVV